MSFLHTVAMPDARRAVIGWMLHLPAPPVAEPEAHFVGRVCDAMRAAGAETTAVPMSRCVQLEDASGPSRGAALHVPPAASFAADLVPGSDDQRDGASGV